MAVPDYQRLMAPSLEGPQDGKARTTRQARDAWRVELIRRVLGLQEPGKGQENAGAGSSPSATSGPDSVPPDEAISAAVELANAALTEELFIKFVTTTRYSSSNWF
jgi:restriction endonuclease Mrr